MPSSARCTPICSSEPLGTRSGRPAGVLARHLADGAGDRGRRRRVRSEPTCSPPATRDVFTGDDNWRSLAVPTGEMFVWDDDLDLRTPSAVLRRHDPRARRRSTDITDARVLALLGDSVTTDHISPAGAIKQGRPRPGRYLTEHGVGPGDFNSYGSRRGNHEVMIRGTFANIRLRNQLVPDVEGGFTRHLPTGADLSASTTPRSPIAPTTCRWSSSPAPSTAPDRRAIGRRRARMLLGVKAVLATSFERIHRSNLIDMGVLPLQFRARRVRAEPRPHRRGALFDHRATRRRPGPDRGDRPRRAQRRDPRDHRDRTDRHSGRGRVLRARWNPAVRPAPTRRALRCARRGQGADGARRRRRRRTGPGDLLVARLSWGREVGGRVEQPAPPHAGPGEGVGGVRRPQAAALGLPRRTFDAPTGRPAAVGAVSSAHASRTPQVAVVVAPGSRRMTLSPVWKALGGHVIGSTASPRRRRSGRSVSAVYSSTYG